MSVDPADAAACRGLWSAVILRALRDLKSDSITVRRSAMHWFDPNDRSYRRVCDLAAIDPDALYEKHLEIVRGKVLDLGKEKY